MHNLYDIDAQTWMNIMPVNLFCRYNAVGRSKGLDDLGGMQIHLVICLFIAWAFVVLAVIKGVKTLGKVCCLHTIRYIIKTSR